MIPVKKLRDRMIQELNRIYPENESRTIAEILISKLSGIDRIDLLIDPERVLDDDLEATLGNKLAELMASKPLQYVTGRAYFYDFEIEVNPSVLIPRPETEELVRWVLNDFRDDPGLKILDIGTGSGCIIIALGRHLKKSSLTAVDSSPGAIITATRNAASLGVEVNFIEADLFDAKNIEKMGKFDLIVSNPPYVMQRERAGMHPNVLNFEPHSALFVPDDDPLVFYRAISKIARQNLTSGGKLYLEFNESLGLATANIFKEAGFDEVSLKSDMQGKERFLRCRLTGVNP